MQSSGRINDKSGISRFVSLWAREVSRFLFAMGVTLMASAQHNEDMKACFESQESQDYKKKIPTPQFKALCNIVRVLHQKSYPTGMH